MAGSMVVVLTARLQHPNIVPILDSGALPAPDGRSLPWYAMAYLEGETLRSRMPRERQLRVCRGWVTPRQHPATRGRFA
jgi:hypothetical protein